LKSWPFGIVMTPVFGSTRLRGKSAPDKIVPVPIGTLVYRLMEEESDGIDPVVAHGEGAMFVDFSLPQQQLTTLTVGMPVKVKIEASDAPAVDGTIAAVDPTIDSTTRMIKLRASVPNAGEALRPGMFAQVAVILPGAGTVVIAPLTAIVHASFGDSVFVVEAKKPDSPGAKTTQDGKVIKNAGFRQRCVIGGDLVEIRWATGARGVVHNLTKNFFAVMSFQWWRAIGFCILAAIANILPFAGVLAAHGAARIPYAIALACIFFLYAGMSVSSGVGPWYFVLHPLATLLIIYTTLHSMIFTLWRGGVEWRGTFYPLDELRKGLV